MARARSGGTTRKPTVRTRPARAPAGQVVRPVAVIVGGVRTPFVRAWSAFGRVPAEELARVALREVVTRLALDPATVDEVVLGCAAMPADAPNIARVAALMAGLPREVPALTVQRNCGSALEAIALAADRIAAGRAHVVLAGGVESMSRIPFFFSGAGQAALTRLARAKGPLAKAAAALRLRPRHFRPVVGLEVGLTDPVCGRNMGQTADALAREWGISREAQDAYAAESHRRALAAEAAGRFAAERMAFPIPPDFATVQATDVGPRTDSTPEKLATLRPVFDRQWGTVTAGNASQLTDGAAVVCVMSEARARALRLAPLGRIVGHAVVGLEPERMGLGPAVSLPRALAEAGATMHDLDLVEMNEAFAAVVLANQRALSSTEFARERLGAAAPPGEVPAERLNVNGGAIALGHPVGATGARLVLTLLHEMARRGAALGAATLCIGGGQGAAMVLERR